MRLPLGLSDFLRGVAETAGIRLLNRYYEASPENQEDQVALLCRPGVRKWLEVGAGPIRAIYSQPGSFDDTLFVVSGAKLYSVETDETITELGSVTGTGAVSMAATAYPFHLFVANGASLQVWDGATLAAVTVPDTDGIVSVGFIAGYIICVVAQGEQKNGRFYWIEPNDITIDPTNFATAERSPDPVWQVEVVGDQFWLPGTSSNEVWYLTGDSLAPFLRQQARVFDKGIWEGTIIKIKDSVVAVGTDGTVYEITDAQRVVSTPDISQRFREAIALQRAS